jgi:1-acyl-sn-glycerol-3-phosphate acyltransferase
MDKPAPKIQYAPPVVIEFIRHFGKFVSKILWRIEFHGTENIPQNLSKGLLVVANHQSYFDPFWLCFPIHRKFRFMAWDAATEWFFVGKCIRFLGAFPVSLKGKGARRAMVEALRSLRDGATLIIFPEGSRSFSDGKLLPFKPGAVRLAIEAGVPILPVSIRGANKVWAQDIKFPRPKKVELIYHPVFEIPPIPEGLDEHQFAEEVSQKLRAIIESKL